MSTPEDRAHTNRRRAESFGGVAQQYDVARPSYPTALIDDLVVLQPVEVLDVGCGTGKAATLLSARGLHVLGVEVDKRMAEVARGHGLDVEVGTFEAWEPAGRSFDLITCAQAWHWIDGAVGAPKAAALLRPGGMLALFWNFARFDVSTQRALDAAYAAFAPDLSRHSVVRGGGPATVPSHLTDLAAAGFAVEHRSYDWTHAYPRDEWLALLRTHSDHSTLAADRLDRLTAAIGAAIDRLGGALVARYRTETLLGSLSVRTGMAG